MALQSRMSMPRSRAWRVGAALTAWLSAALAVAGPAAGASPDREPVDFTHLSTETELCSGVSIAVVEHGYGFAETFTGAGGTLTLMLHLTVDYAMTANGITVIERDRKEWIVTDERFREMASGHILAPTGTYQVGGGGQVTIAADGTVTVNGRPPELDVDAFCAAFLP